MGMKGNTWSVRRLLAASAAFAAGATCPALGDLVAPKAEAPLMVPAPGDMTQGLDAAAALLRDGKPVHARAILLELMRGGGVALSNSERERGYELLRTASNRIRMMSPVELSLQRAALALSEGDIGACLSHTAAVLDTPGIGVEELLRAELLQEEADMLRSALRPVLAAKMGEARAAFAAGSLDAALPHLMWIDRSGLHLSEAQHAEINAWRLAIVDAGLLRGADILTLGAMEAAPAAPVTPAATQPESNEDIDRLLASPEREEALRLLSEANTARQERRLNEALDLYRRVDANFASLLTAEEAQRVRSNIEAVRVELSGAGADPDATIQELVSVRRRFEAQFQQSLSEGDRMLQTGDFRNADREALRARDLINSLPPAAYSPGDIDRFNAQVDTLETRVEAARIARERRDTDNIAREAAERARQARTQAEREKREQIDRAILRVREFQVQQEYRQALEVIESEILAVDPRNPIGLLLKDIITDTLIVSRTRDLTKQKGMNIRILGMENEEAAIPPLNIVDFPPDWPAISINRGLQTAYVESPENRQVFARLDSQRVPQLETDRELERVIAFIGSIGNFDIDVDWEALENIGISRNQRVSLSLRNKPLKAVLERTLDKVSDSNFSGDRAWYAVQDGIVVISSDRMLRRNKFEQVYDVRDLITEIPDYDNAPEFDLNQILQASRGGGGQSPFQQTGGEDVDRIPYEERVEQMKDIIRALVDPGEWREDGGETGAMYDWQGQLIVTQTADNHRAIRGLLSMLRDQRALQINVETRFLLVSQDFFEQIGFDLDVYFNANSNVVTNAQAGDPNILPSDFFQFGLATPGGRRVARQVNTPDGTPQVVTPPDRWTPIGAAQNSLGIASALIPAAGIAQTVLSGAPALGVAGTFLDDIQVDFVVQATQADTRSVTLTAPRLTFTNGQRSNIFVVTQIGFVSDLEPVVSDSAVGFDPTIDVISEGVRMVVDGTVTADRRYVQMNIDAAVAQIEGFAEQAVTAVAGGQLVNSADTQSFVQIPTTTVTRVQTTVTVPDQGTLLLGGQRIVSEFEVESGVPVLSKIPILNRFFSNRIQTKEEQTLLILVKPTVIIQSEQEERAFPGLTQELGFGIGG